MRSQRTYETLKKIESTLQNQQLSFANQLLKRFQAAGGAEIDMEVEETA